ncbi:MAG: RNA methyltransferase, partial [Chlorobi bacterium]|nr:RNA methyltransferase [Chlorobiota bacterium]
MSLITSVQNPLVKYVVRLQHKPAFRRKEGKFVVEGVKETLRAARGGFRPEKLIVCPDILKEPEILNEIPADQKVEVSPKVYAHMAYRGGTEGLMAVGAQKPFVLNDRCKGKRGLILVAERIQKPGNIGALLRTTDAVGTDCAVFIDPATDLYNPNVIRASLGTLFTQPVAVASAEELEEFLKKHRIRLFAATL